MACFRSSFLLRVPVGDRLDLRFREALGNAVHDGRMPLPGLERLHLQQTSLEQALADQAIYDESNKEQLKMLLMEKAENDQALAAVEEAWLETSEALESG